MIHQPTRLYHQLIKFAGQYGGWSDLRHLGVMGKDDGWTDWRGEGKSNQMDRSYSHKSSNRGVIRITVK